MKECPKCHSIVDAGADYECKVCGESIFYEPYKDADREYIAKGYRLRYWLPKLKLPIAATIIFVIAALIHWRLDGWTMLAAGLTAVTWLSVFLKRLTVQLMLWKYNEDYIKWRVEAGNIWLAVIAILSSLFLLFAE